MKHPLIIGITGGIGGGKSTFCAGLIELNELIYNTDKEAKRIQNSNIEVIEAIKKNFGNNIYSSDGKLNRTKLASIVFSNKKLLKVLNDIVHPAVREDLANWKRKNSDRKFLFVECAILFETGFVELVDDVILVTASESERIDRVIRRDGITEIEVRERMKNQMSDRKKATMSRWVVNTEKVALTTEKVKEILQNIRAEMESL